MHMRTRMRASAAAAALLVTALALSACSSGGTSTGSTAGAVPDSLTVSLSQDPDTLDPGATGTNAALLVSAQMFDTLIYHLRDGKGDYQPGLATSYDMNTDATEFTFHLRSDVTFQDGTPLTAEAVKATFDHVADPATKSIVGMPYLGPYKETRIVDDHTATVVFNTPYPAFADQAAQPSLAISSPTALTKWGADYGQHPVGTGPFSFVSWTKGQEVVLERNPAYNWGPEPLGTGPATISKLTIKVLTDQTAEYNALRTGEIDAADNLTSQDLSSAQSSGMHVTSAIAAGLPFGFFLNSTLAPLNDPAVRQAIVNGVDRKAIVDTLFQGVFTPSTGVLTPGSSAYVDGSEYLKYDPDAATAALQKAGWSMGSDGIMEKGGQKLTLQLADLTDWSTWGYGDMATLIQAQLKKIGVDLQITSEPQSTALPKITSASDPYHLAPMFYWAADPSLLRNTFGTAGLDGYNWGRTSDPALDAAFDAADASTTGRIAAYKNIVSTLNSESLYLPIYDLQFSLVSPTVSSVEVSPEGLPYYKTVK
ncbi:MAG: ABC-type transporter, periplasmic subunit [Subtercola sp.]|nr:ABC-type transporter, periplasmic subunit [Subtercola sp.]